jgi:hypothetical protein
MGGVARWLFMVCAVLFLNVAGAMCSQNNLATPIPKWTVKLDTFGWHPPRSISDREFFKDFTIAKLEALDSNTKICFVSNDVVAAYHTNEEGRDWRTAGRWLEVFFISAKDGRLLDKKKWPTVARGNESDRIDSESRLVPLSDGRFLVFANRTMMLYGNNLELLGEERLEPSTSGDLWSAQSVAGGHKIFLRHQSASKQQATYFWLSPETFRPISQMSGFSGLKFSVAVTAGDGFVLTGAGFSGPGRSTGIARIGLDGSTTIVCSDEICRDGGPSMVSSRLIAISGRYGIGVLDLEHKLLWSHQISSTRFDFNLLASIKTAMSGNRFAVWMDSTYKIQFDGVKVSDWPKLLLYNTSDPHHLLAIPFDHRPGQSDFALSPDGGEVAILDGTRIKLYAVD